jgi:hypothetical protein
VEREAKPRIYTKPDVVYLLRQLQRRGQEEKEVKCQTNVR